MGRMYLSARRYLFNRGLTKIVSGWKSNIVVFLLFSLFLCELETLAQIASPRSPRPIPPPNVSPNSGYQDLIRKRKQREVRRVLEEGPVLSPSEKRNRGLMEEALTKRELSFMLQMTAIVPFIKTDADRSDYTTDITTHFSLAFRGFPKKKAADIQLWWGFRTAMFSGTGIYQKTPGRYGFTYFGPMIGVGRISPADSVTSGFRPEAKRSVSEYEFPTRIGWLLMTGIAGQSRLSTTDRSNSPVDNDFDHPKGVVFDAPGLWAEATFITVHFGALGVNYTAGVQMGKGKTFLYAGIGLAGFH